MLIPTLPEDRVRCADVHSKQQQQTTDHPSQQPLVEHPLLLEQEVLTVRVMLAEAATIPLECYEKRHAEPLRHAFQSARIRNLLKPQPAFLVFAEPAWRHVYPKQTAQAACCRESLLAAQQCDVNAAAVVRAL
jgi:hypothetical protein